MIGRDREFVGRRTAHLFTIASLGLLLVLSGCTGFRQVMGLDRSGPDEFAVESRAPLTIPPDFDLRPPQPGAPRPQEAPVAERARRVMDTAGPGEPGKQATFALKAPDSIAGPQLDPSQQVGDQSLASKLLGTGDTVGTAATKRQTDPLKGVY